MNISELARQIGPQVSEISLVTELWFRIDQSLICTVVPFFYSRYVRFGVPSLRTLAVTIQYYSVGTERTGLSS